MTSKSQKSTEVLLEEAATQLEHSQPDSALPLVQEALQRLEADKEAYTDIDILLQNAAQEKATLPTALVLGADIYLALGSDEHIDRARVLYERAVEIDPNGALVSAEPYLQLSQLCEDGGQKSIDYFEKAIEVMKNEIEVLSEQMDIEGTQEIVDTRRAKVAEALCGMTEVYMTDLSWEVNAEQRCEQLVTEAVAVCPDYLSAGVLQTLASIRISQERTDEAKQALAQSMSVWKDAPTHVDSPQRPDFATRISLVRLLMEVEHEEDAMPVVEDLVRDDDDQSVEAWYLGGWCHLLLSQKQANTDKSTHIEQARSWLGTCLRLYTVLDYRDVKLKQHAEELVRQLNKTLNLPEGDDEWETDGEQEDAQAEGDGEIEAHEADDHDVDVEMT